MDKLPEDTSRIKTLTVKQAKALMQEEGGLFLDGLTTLSDEAAKALGQYKGGVLFLDGLTSLSDEAAKALAQCKGGLSLDGLTALSDEAAKALAQHEGGVLWLNSLTTLSDEAAKALRAHSEINLPEEFRRVPSDGLPKSENEAPKRTSAIAAGTDLGRMASGVFSALTYARDRLVQSAKELGLLREPIKHFCTKCNEETVVLPTQIYAVPNTEEEEIGMAWRWPDGTFHLEPSSGEYCTQHQVVLVTQLFEFRNTCSICGSTRKNRGRLRARVKR